MMRLSLVLACFLGSLSDSSLRAEKTIRLTSTTDTEIRDVIAQITRERLGGDSSPRTVVLPTGTFRLTDPLRINPGLVGEGLTFRALKPGQTILSGAIHLAQGIREGNLWRYRLPDRIAKTQRPQVILVAGKLSHPARHPNVGYLRIGATAEDRRSGFRFGVGDVPSKLSLEDGECDLIFLHDWSTSRLPIRSIDHATRELLTVGPIGCEASHYAIDHFEKRPRYCLSGHAALADLPGEWFWDQDNGDLVMVAGHEDAPPKVEIPISEHLVLVEGDDEPMLNFCLEGLVFTGTRFPMPSGGLAGAQASMHEPRDEDGDRVTSNRPMLSASVQLIHTHHAVIKACRFQSIGNSGLWIGSRARHCVIEDCVFDSLGGNAVNLGEDNHRRIQGRTWFQSEPEQVPTGNRIVGNTIRRCGEVLYGSVAIWCPLNRELEIGNNHISDCPYTGISLGWMWSQDPSPALGNRVHHNRITRVMQVLSDGAGIYTLGQQPGSEIASNVIDNVPLNVGRAESNGIFMDQGSMGFVVTDNEFRRIAKSPVRFHQAGTNRVSHNRWELETDQTPPVRFNNTAEELIEIMGNETLEREKRIFLIGNSLTWDTRPPLLDDYVDWHVDCGKSLPFIFANPKSPCVASSRIWPVSLKQLSYDYLCVQPHYGSTLEQDLKVISDWMEMQPAAALVIHSGWAREETQQAEFDEAVGTEMVHHPAYFDQLTAGLRERYPTRTIRHTNSTRALHQVIERIESGGTPFKNGAELYRDAIHMTHGEGRYLMHNLMRLAVQQSPSDEGFPIKESTREKREWLKTIINQQFQQVIQD